MWLAGAVLAAGLFLQGEATAGNPWTWFRSLFPKNRVDVLLVSGNYAKPRLLAELAQKSNHQPLLLISPTANGEELYLLPAGNEATVTKNEKFVELVEFMQPRQVIFLGDSDYMPAQYIELIRNRFPVAQVIGDDWNKNAQNLAQLLHLRKLPKRYAELLLTLEEATIRRPLAMPSSAGAMLSTPAEPVSNPQPLPFAKMK